MKIKEQTRKLGNQPQAVLEYGKATLTRFEEIFEEYESILFNLDLNYLG